MNANWSSSFDRPTQPYASPLGVYFPFGEERQKIKNYVFQQLHGSSTLQNEEILKKFREEATIRRHHHLHRLSYTEQTPEEMNTLDTLPTLSPNQHPNMRYAKYIPRKYRIDSIEPTLKAQPPIYRKSTIDFEDQNITRRKTNSNIRLNDAQKYSVSKEKLQVYVPKGKKRSQSQEVKLPYKQHALRKIKQIAQARRAGKQVQSRTSTSSSQLLEELELREQQSRMECNRLGMQLRRFKKYRKYIQNINE